MKSEAREAIIKCLAVESCVNKIENTTATNSWPTAHGLKYIHAYIFTGRVQGMGKSN